VAPVAVQAEAVTTDSKPNTVAPSDAPVIERRWRARLGAAVDLPVRYLDAAAKRDN
jgi:hypothetical protein